MSEGEKTVRVRCPQCGNGYRNHRVLFETKKSFGHPEEGWDHDECHQFIQCMGCETIRYHRFCLGQEYDPYTNEPEPYGEHTYPDDELEPGKRPVMDFGDEADQIPENVWKMYKETVVCLNSKARTLAGGGLRATVEAICLNQGITSGNLQNKIDELVQRGLLTKAQADLLHEERYIGNAALHEMATPDSEDIEDGLMIVEGLLNTIYVLPAKAERLKKRRESKKSKPHPPKKK